MGIAGRVVVCVNAAYFCVEERNMLLSGQMQLDQHIVHLSELEKCAQGEMDTFSSKQMQPITRD